MGKKNRREGVIKIRIYFFCLVLFVIPYVTAANTVISGIQSGILSKKGNPYIVTDDIIIPKGLTLKIEAGVIIKFSGPFRFIVAGALIAEGDLANRIIFTSRYDADFGDENNSTGRLPNTSDWYGIDFTDTSNDYLNVIDYAIIRYCKYGIRCREVKPLLTHIIFANIANNSMVLNNTNVAIHHGVDYDYITVNQRPVIEPVPKPLPESEEEKQKRIEEQKYALLQKAIEDSIRKAKKIKPIDTNCGILIYDRYDIERFSFETVPEILGFLPGFINMASYEEQSVVTNRGIFPGQFNNRVLFLLNGIPIYDGITNSTYYEFLPISTVERIEIRRGPDSAIWGKSAFSAVVNIITKQTEQPVTILTTTELGSFYTKKITSQICLNKGNFDFCIGTGYQDNDGYWRTIKQDECGNEFPLKYENDNYNLLASISSKKLNIEAGYYKRKQYQFGVIPIQQYGGLAEREGLLVNINYLKKINKNFSSTISARYNRTVQQSDAGELGTISTNTNPPNFTLSNGYLFQAEAKINYSSEKFPTSFGFTTGREGAKHIFALLNNKYGDVIDDFRVDTSPYKNEFSVFAFSGYNISHVLGCSGGLRWSYLGEGSDYFLSPTIKLIFNPFAPYHVQLSYRHGYRSPSIWERQILIRDILYSAKILLPEENRSLDMEIEYSFSEMSNLSICGYWEAVSNLIQQRQLTTDERAEYYTSTGYIFDNSDIEYQVIGGEVSFRGNISRKISMLINSTYQQLKDKSINQTIQSWPNLVGNMSINYQFNFNLVSSLAFQYIGKQKIEETETTIKPCYLLNLKLAFKLLSNVSLEINSNNLLDNECFYVEYNRRKIPSIPGGYPRAFFFILKSEF